jgi:hypothetical protein
LRRSSPQNLWGEKSFAIIEMNMEFLGYSLISFGVFGLFIDFIWSFYGGV